MTHNPTTAVERLQAIIDWADLAFANKEKFDSHGVRNLDGPVFDAAREFLAAQAAAPIDVAADAFLAEVRAELIRARAKFPGDRIMTIALAEEFGELCKAVLDEPAANVRKEAVQTAVMAARIVLDGDGSVTEWRSLRGLDPLLPATDGNPYRWYYSAGSDIEYCHLLTAATRDEAVEEAKTAGGFGPGDTFTIVEARKSKIQPLAAELIIEQTLERAADEGLFGEDGDYSDGPGVEAEAELDALLRAWADRHSSEFPQVWLFGDQRGEETITLPGEPAKEEAEAGATLGLSDE